MITNHKCLYGGVVVTLLGFSLEWLQPIIDWDSYPGPGAEVAGYSLVTVTCSWKNICSASCFSSVGKQASSNFGRSWLPLHLLGAEM